MSMNEPMRGQLVPTPVLVAVAVGFVLTLGYLWKSGDAIREVAVSETPSPVSLTYLKALATEDDANTIAKLDLAQQLLKAGEIAQASVVAEGVAKDPGLSALARVLLAEIWVHAAVLSTATGQDRAHAQQQAAEQLGLLAGAKTLNSEQLPKIIELARALARPELAASVVESVAAQDADPRLWKQASELYLEAGFVRQATFASHFGAMLLTGAERREAAKETERLALSTGDPLLAAELAAMHLEHNPTAELLQHQIDLELQAGRPTRAVDYAVELVKLNPAALEPRETLAVLALAADRPEVALRQFDWLARHTQRTADFEQALALASGLQDLDALLSLLEWSNARNPSVESALQLAQLLEQGGRTEAAVGTLQNAKVLFPDSKAILLTLRDVLLRDRNYAAAAEVAAEVTNRFGDDADAVMQQAAIHLQMGDVQSAIDVLLASANGESAELQGFLADLAVVAGHQGLAHQTHRSLYERGLASYAQAQRLWLIEYASGELDLAAQIAIEAYDRFAEPDAIMFALRTQLERNELSEADALIAQAERGGPSVTGRADYWELRTHRTGLSIRAAMEERDLEKAKREAAEIESLLGKAANAHPGLSESAEYERSSQSVQRWQTQLAEASLVPLSAQIWALQDEEQSTGAWNLGAEGLRGGLSEAERDAVESQMEAIARKQPRNVSAQFEGGALQGVTALGSAAGTEYSWSKGGVSADAAARSLSYDLFDYTEDPATSLLEVDANLGGFVRDPAGKSYAEVGLVSRDGDVAPTGKFGWTGTLRDRVTLSAEAGINEIANETAFLRVFGKQDRLQVTATGDIGERWFVGASTRADRFLDENRDLVGTGFSIDAQSGYRIWNERTKWNVALSARAAPRYPKDQLADGTELINSSAGWTGITTSFSRGDLGVPVPTKLRPRYLAELSAGVLLPDPSFGYGLRAGLGLGHSAHGELRILGGVSNATVNSMGQAQGKLEIVYAHALSR